MLSEAGVLFRMGPFCRCKNRTHFFCYVLEACAELCDFRDGRGWITQAALLKTAHWAVFALSSATAPLLFESPRHCESDVYTKENRQCISTPAVFYGRGWIRTTEAKSSRFTVCPHWPLGNTPLYSFLQSRTACIYYHSGACLSTAFYSFFGKIRMLDGMAQSRGRP